MPMKFFNLSRDIGQMLSKLEPLKHDLKLFYTVVIGAPLVINHAAYSLCISC